MKSILQNLFSRPLSNKSLHDREFVIAPSLKPARIVKNVSVMTGEAKFMLDGVLATLAHGSGRAEAKYECD